MSLIKIASDRLNLAVAPMGAEMQYLRTATGDDLLWDGDAAFWTGRAPVLFPIVGRAVDDMVAVGTHKGPMPQHGFARRNTFELEAQTPTMCRHILRQSEATRAVFPFDFDLRVAHQLDGSTLTVSVRISNEGDTQMPFGFGFHPAFRWPLPNAGDAAHHVTLAGGGTPDMRGLNDGLLEPAPIAGPFAAGDLVLTDGIFANGALVFPNGTDALRYGPREGPSLSFTFQNLPDLALWRPLGAPFVCIEPWHGTASYVGDGPEIAARPNALTLDAGKSATFGYQVTYTA